MDSMPDRTEAQWPGKNGRCEMPDLSKLSFLSVFLMIHRALAAGGPKDRTSYALVMNFVRIVDKLVADYGLARDQMVLWANTPNEVIGHLLVAVGHFESCVGSCVRAIEFGRKIRSDRNGPRIIPRGLPVLSDAVFNRINGMRNSTEHLEGAILKGTLADGPICLAVRPKSIELGGEQVNFDELADWITQLHGIADQLAHFREA